MRERHNILFYVVLFVWFAFANANKWNDQDDDGHGKNYPWPKGNSNKDCHSYKKKSDCEESSDLLCFWEAEHGGICREGPPYACSGLTLSLCTLGQTQGRCYVQNGVCVEHIHCGDFTNTDEASCENAGCSWIPLDSDDHAWICTAEDDLYVDLEDDGPWLAHCELHHRHNYHKRWRCDSNCTATFPKKFIWCVPEHNPGVCISKHLHPHKPPCHNTTITVQVPTPIVCSANFPTQVACNTHSFGRCIWYQNQCVTKIPDCSILSSQSSCQANNNVCMWTGTACVAAPPPACHNSTVVVHCSALTTIVQCQTTGQYSCTWFENQCVTLVVQCTDLTATECVANEPICALNPITGQCGPKPSLPCRTNITMPTPIVCSNFTREDVCEISGRGMCQWFNGVCVTIVVSCTDIDSSTACLANDPICSWVDHKCVPTPTPCPVCYNTTIEVPVPVPTPIVCSQITDELQCNLQTYSQCTWDEEVCVVKLQPCSVLLEENSCEANEPLCVWNSNTETCSENDPDPICHNSTTIITVVVNVPVFVPVPIVCSSFETVTACMTQSQGECVWDGSECVDVIYACDTLLTIDACNANTPLCQWDDNNEVCAPPPCPTCHNTTVYVLEQCSAAEDKDQCDHFGEDCTWYQGNCVNHIPICDHLPNMVSCLANGHHCIWNVTTDSCQDIPLPTCQNITTIVIDQVPIPLVCEDLPTENVCNTQGAAQCIWYNAMCVDKVQPCDHLPNQVACLANADNCIWLDDLEICIPIPPPPCPTCQNTTVYVQVPVPVPAPIFCHTYLNQDACLNDTFGKCIWYGSCCVDRLEPCSALTRFDACIANSDQCSWVDGACVEQQPQCQNSTVIVPVPTPIVCDSITDMTLCQTTTDNQCIWFNGQCIIQVIPCNDLETQDQCNANGEVCTWTESGGCQPINCDNTNLTCDQLQAKFDQQCSCPSVEWP